MPSLPGSMSIVVNVNFAFCASKLFGKEALANLLNSLRTTLLSTSADCTSLVRKAMKRKYEGIGQAQAEQGLKSHTS